MLNLELIIRVQPPCWQPTGMYRDGELDEPQIPFAPFQRGTPALLSISAAGESEWTRRGWWGQTHSRPLSRELERDPFLPTPASSRLLGEVALACRLGSAPSCAALFPGARAECFLFPPPPPLPVHCLWDSSGVPGSPRAARALSPPGSCPRAHQAVSNLDAMHLAPSDHSRLFDGTNDDLGLRGPRPPQTEINPASAQTRGLRPCI